MLAELVIAGALIALWIALPIDTGDTDDTTDTDETERTTRSRPRHRRDTEPRREHTKGQHR